MTKTGVTSLDLSDPIAERLADVLVDSLAEPGEIYMEDELFGDLGLDSLDRTDFHREVEMEFDISIPEIDTQQLLTVGDWLAYLQQKLPS